MTPTPRTAAVAFLAAALLALSAVSCGGDGGAPATPSVTPAVTPAATPTAGATSTPRPSILPPAALGYQAVPAVPSATFDLMLGFYPIPGAEGEALVLTQHGQIWRVAIEGTQEPALFAGLSDRVIENPADEEGLLGLAFSPAFETDDEIYLYYTAGPPRRSVLSRFSVADERLDLDSEQVVLEIPQPFPNHNGGQLAFGPDGYLYVGLGDGGAIGDPFGNGQDLSTLLGKILRLDVSGDSGYTVPPGNPFIDRDGARPEIFAYGLRNPWRFSFDQATGALWAGDVGQDRWEEIDRIEPGANYGWNVIEGEVCYRAESCDTTGFTPPRAVYRHDDGNCSVTGGYVYRGASMPELDGWFVYGDFCTGRIWAVNTDSDSPPVLLAETGMLISSFGQLPDGELIVVTFANSLFRLERAP